MAKSIKNYTTGIKAIKSIAKIQEILASNGALAIMLNYEKGTGRIASLSFKLELNEKGIYFRLPTNWRKFQDILIRDKIHKCHDEEHVYNVAWKNMFEWVEMQMVIYQLNLVDLQEIFLPYVVTKSGKTFYENILENPDQLLLE